MSSMHYLKQFDKAQLWRLFVDGRFHKKYRGWLGYEEGERGSVQALLNGLAFMLDHFDLSRGLSSTYLLDLHKVCMFNIETSNLKSSPGDLRYLNAGMPFFAKSTTKENLRQILQERGGDGTVIFNTKKYSKTADEFELNELYNGLLKDKRINYRNWYPNLDKRMEKALQKKRSLQEFYHAKHAVQMMFAEKMDDIVDRFNRTIRLAQNEEEQLDCFVLLIRHLELLHPFPDGNCRTFACITLNHLLLYYGFMPTLLYNPNYDGELSTEEFKEEIRKGMTLMEELLKNPEAAVYNYSINDMSKDDREHFLKMAAPVIKKLQQWREIYLTPERVVSICEGEWYRLDPYMRFRRVGDYNTYLSDSLYFFMSLKEWEEEKRDIEAELVRLSDKGVRAIVTDDHRIVSMTDMPVMLVKDIRKAYEKTAMAVRQEVNPTTLLITGTEGKTGAKTQLYQLLLPQTKVHAHINSANTAIPVLRSLINLSEKDRIELNEVSVGSNESLRVERSNWVNPDLCLFTHIGPNHMDMHKTMENLIWAKSSVVVGMRKGGVCIVNSDMEYFVPLCEAIEKRRPGTSIVKFGKSEADDAQLMEAYFDEDRNGWKVTARVQKKVLNYFVPMLQEHTPLASVGMLLSIEQMGLDVKKAAQRYSMIEPYDTMGALRVLHKKEGDVLFYDQSRRGGISGVRSAFTDLARLKKRGKVVALVGGISVKKDSDWTRDAHEQLAELINDSSIDQLYTTGPFMQYVHEKLKDPMILQGHSDDLDVLAKQLTELVMPGDTLFIIGSAYLYLGRVVDRIKKRYSISLFRTDEKYKFTSSDQSEYSSAFQLSGFKNEMDFKSELLLKFFFDIQKLFTSKLAVTCVDEKLVEKDQRYVFNADRCKAWFYNDTMDKKEKGLQFFGTFFETDDPTLLIHVQVSTTNLHLGFVRCSRIEDGKIVLQKSGSEELAALCNRFADVMTPRKWWRGWCTMDCGKIIDLNNSAAFTLLKDFEHDSSFVHFKPLLKGLIGGDTDGK